MSRIVATASEEDSSTVLKLPSLVPPISAALTTSLSEFAAKTKELVTPTSKIQLTSALINMLRNFSAIRCAQFQLISVVEMKLSLTTMLHLSRWKSEVLTKEKPATTESKPSVVLQLSKQSLAALTLPV